MFSLAFAPSPRFSIESKLFSFLFLRLFFFVVAARRWRALINFSRCGLLSLLRRYGIFPLRFSNRSSMLDPFDSPFFLLLSPSSTLPSSSSRGPPRTRSPIPFPPACVRFPRCTRVCVGSAGARRHEHEGEYEGERERENAEDVEKDERVHSARAFSIPGTLVRI